MQPSIITPLKDSTDCRTKDKKTNESTKIDERYAKEGKGLN